MQRQLPFHMQRQLPLHMERQLPFTCWGNHLFMWRGNHLFMWRGDCLFMWKLTVDPLCDDHWSAPRSTVLIASVMIASALITSMTIVDHPMIKCWSHLHWSPLWWTLISPRINSVDHLCVNPLCINCLYDNCQPPMINSVDHLCINHLYINCLYDDLWSPGSTVLITSVSIDSASITLWWSSIPSHRINSGNPLFTCRGDHLFMWRRSWLLILSAVIIDPPQHNQQTEMIKIFWAKLGKHVSMHCFTEYIPFGKVKLIRQQGQTLQFVGIYLPDHVFAHGQLYVAFSTVTDPSVLAVCLNSPDGFTRNIVFQEVLWLSMYTLSRTMRSLCPSDIPSEAQVGH